MKTKLLILSALLLIGSKLTAQDNFDPYTEPEARVPHIGTVSIQLLRTVNPAVKNQEQVNYYVIVDDQFHNTMDIKEGNLIPHLTDNQKQAIQAFMDAMWQKAEDEILP